MNDLYDLAIKHESQKVDYKYMIDGYQKHLPETCDNFLEIGVLFLGSTKMFRDFYDGKAKIHALDLYHPDFVTEKQAIAEGFKAYKGSQTNIDLLATLPSLDVISEDGSHHSDDQIVTFKYLFLNKLLSGGLYVLEDVHCCYDPYWWVTVTSFENTMLGVLHKMRDGGNMVSQFFTQEESDLYMSLIESVHIYNGNGSHTGKDSIVFIYKAVKLLLVCEFRYILFCERMPSEVSVIKTNNVIRC